jgi:hypothetical protein
VFGVWGLQEGFTGGPRCADICLPKSTSMRSVLRDWLAVHVAYVQGHCGPRGSVHCVSAMHRVRRLHAILNLLVVHQVAVLLLWSACSAFEL